MANGAKERFVPSGVDAQSWLGFEERVQARRFRALLETIREALSAGDVIVAQMALDEARELRPDAPELAEIAKQVAAASAPPDAPAERADARTRALSAVLLLLIGIALLTGIDWIRAARDQSRLPAISSPTPHVATPVSAPEPEQEPVTIVPPPPASELAEPDSIGTSGLQRAMRSEPQSSQATFRAASTLPPGEIPDDFVYRPVNRRPLVANRSRPEPAPRAANAAFTPASPASGPSVASSLSRRDEAEVAAALDKYARAYRQLDTDAAREVWPTVNETALARAFAGLAAQDIEFEDCEIAVHGATAAASCRGTTSVVRKLGSAVPRVEPRTWKFELRRDGEAWKIENAEARRP